MNFKLNGQEYIQMNDLLKVLALVGTGGEAKMRILDGEAKLNGKIELAIRKKIRAGDVVSFAGEKITVEQ
jgi:ribosome-associated protein